MYAVFKIAQLEHTVEEAPMNRVVRIILLAFISITALGGCLVKKQDPVLIARTTDNLRVYQPDDYINYFVTATTVPLIGTPSTLTGTLRVEWIQHADLIRPVTGTPVPVIQEVTTLNLGGAASNEGTVRYISQDANGEITLHALEAPGTDVHYWLSDLGVGDLSTTASSVFFYSPIVPGIKPQTNFVVMDDCEGNANCASEVGRYIDDQNVVGDSVSVTSNLGIFVNPFQINFSGSSTPSPAPLPITFDIRNVCDTNITQHGDAGNGRMYVMPEIGMIRMENTCRSVISNDVVIYTITISNTNIPLP